MSKFIVLVSIYTLFSCTKAKVENVCTIPATVSFQQDIQPIFNTNCATSGCHAGTKPAGTLNLEASVAYENLTDPKSGYLDTVNPKASLLYTSMTSVTNPMPPNGKLSKCTSDRILKWIEQKAKNN
jgi:hypothetical protein